MRTSLPKQLVQPVRALSTAASAALVQGKRTGDLPVTVDGWIDRLGQITKDPRAAAFLDAFRGASASGAAAALARDRSVLLSAAVDVALGYQDTMVRNARAQHATSPDEDTREIIDLRVSQYGELASEARRAKAALGT